MAITCNDIREVIGGAGSGGIIVRKGLANNSLACARLSTGAKIKIVESSGSRVSYELISGDGPQKGWVATTFQGRDLLAKTNVESCANALEEYCSRFGELPQKRGFQRKAFPWGGYAQAGREESSSSSEIPKLGEQQVVELENEMGPQQAVLDSQAQKAPKLKLSATAKSGSLPGLPGSQAKGWAEDSDGDDVRICLQCNLPLGDFSYNRGGNCVHGECMVQLMVHDMRSEEDIRNQNEKAKKAEQHCKYGIGWRPAEHIPCNGKAASKLALRDVPQGMVCLVLDEDTSSIRVGATMEPSASMNLEYLSTALQVRRVEGHEPVFSLNPVDAQDKNTMHEKVFVPEWLEGTAAGEVLFQADYHLKELSMGVYEQPVIGMKSCFDFTEIDEMYGWNAREWFLVRKAEVQISEKNMLIPRVKMGVEAREQVVNGNGLQDKPITQPDHPMVKYAAGFTHNFDLIAERKSVVYHLRELAKAAVMAKYLLESGAQLEESWFSLASSKEEVCSLQVPQLWNERTHSQVHIKDGSIRRDQSMEVTHGVYGGVQFGLDKFSLGLVSSIGQQPPRAAAGVQALSLATTLGRAGAGMAPQLPQHRLAFGLSRNLAQPISSIMSLPGSEKFKSPSAELSVSEAITGPPMRGLGAPRLSAMPVGVTMMPRAGLSSLGGPAMRNVNISAPSQGLQGVDLRMDQFDLSEAKRVSLEVQAGSWGAEVRSLDKCVAVGPKFFACLDGSTKLFKDADQSLLLKIFDPTLSDRRSEGDLFVPPDASHSYVQHLRALVKEEDLVSACREEAFFGEEFEMENPGTLFPHSWTPSIGRGREQPTSNERPQGSLVPRPEFEGRAVLSELLRTSSPVYDRVTEEGVRFRIYSIGSLEVRSTQELGRDEIIGAVFSRKTQSAVSSQATSIDEQAMVTKVSEYVERVHSVPGAKRVGRRYFLVLETETTNKIVTERLSDGQSSWVFNPEGIEDRCSLAKLTRLESCSMTVTIHSMMTCRAKLGEGSPLSSKRFCQAMYIRAVGSERSIIPSNREFSLDYFNA